MALILMFGFLIRVSFIEDWNMMFAWCILVATGSAILMVFSWTYVFSCAGRVWEFFKINRAIQWIIHLRRFPLVKLALCFQLAGLVIVMYPLPYLNIKILLQA